MSALLPRIIVDNDTPQRLGVVAAQFGLTAAALRTEAQRGRLVIARVAGKDWTSVAEVQRMFGLCRVTREALTCGSDQPASERAAAIARYGSSETPDTSAALASAWASVKRLRRRSPTISPANMHRRVANATSPAYQSPT
jgi:hypothetical protein